MTFDEFVTPRPMMARTRVPMAILIALLHGPVFPAINASASNVAGYTGFGRGAMHAIERNRRGTTLAS